MKIIDNFLPKELFEEFSRNVISSEFNWSFSENDRSEETPYIDTLKLQSVFPDDEIIPHNLIQFIHPIYVPVRNYSGIHTKNEHMTMPVVEYTRSKIDWKVLLSAKVNMTFMHDKSYIMGFHNDYTFPVLTPEFKTGILYLNDTDGDTLLSTGERIQSVKNRFVYFPGDTIQHSGMTCTNSSKRTTINFNFI
jgi:hypothetical protein